MKKIKKVLAVLVTLAMLMAMSLTAFAEETEASATVTINGADNTQYYYMQLVVEDRDSVLGWQFANETISTAFVDAFKGSASSYTAENAIAELIALGLIEPTEAAPEENYYVDNGDINPSAALGAALAALKDNAGKTAITGASVNLSSFGLYMITASNAEYNYIPMAAYINTSYDDVTVTAKGSKNEILKDIVNSDDKSVSEGDVVEYRATTTYPYYSANTVEESRTFVATDVLTNATYNQDSLVVTVGGTTLNPYTEDAETYDYKVEFVEPEDGETFTQKMIITFNYNPSYASEDVVITYDVTVGAGAADVNNTISTTFDTEGDAVTLDKVEVEILKTDDNETNPTPLADATFAIYEAVSAATTGYEEKTVKVYGTEGTTTLYLKDVTTQCIADRTEAKTDSEGKLTFTGLDAQKTYYIKETNAPVGYSLNDFYYALENDGESAPDSDKVYVFNAFDDVTVEDTKLSALPSTGGMGTTLFTIGGCIIMILAAALFFVNRRRSAE